MSTPPPTFRFAPSPNGRLHLGHALSALLNRRMASAAGGRLLLRLEDIDPQRCRPEYEAGILEDLAWLGVGFDAPPIRQSEHLAAHRGALDRLAGAGLLYPCFCSRGEILRAVALRERGGAWPRDPDGAPLYPGTCRTLSATERAVRLGRGEPHTLRLDTGRACAALRAAPLGWTEIGEDLRPERRVAADPAVWGDVVLARRDVPTSYHLAVVVDDAAEGVSHVVRGRDLFEATGLHRLLQALLDLPEPLYHHHRLVLDAAGRKLAKSSGSTALAALRAQGVSPSELAAMLGLAASAASKRPQS